MISLLVVGTLVFVAVILIGTLATVASLIGFLIALPFRILGFVFKLVGALVALPFVLLGLLFAAVFGGGALALGILLACIPLLPVLALGALAWWLLKRESNGGGRDRSHASVVS